MKNLEIIIAVIWGIAIFGLLIIGLDKLFSTLKNGWFRDKLNNFKERREKKKLSKDTSKKQIKQHNKKKGEINFDALKFEYNNICTIVNEAAIKSDLGGTLISEVYILKFNDYFKTKNSYDKKFGGIDSLDTIACLIKALIEEPLSKIASDEEKNIKVLENVIEIFKNQRGIEYADRDIETYSKSKLQLIMRENYRLYNDDIFLIAFYIIEKLYE